MKLYVIYVCAHICARVCICACVYVCCPASIQLFNINENIPIFDVEENCNGIVEIKFRILSTIMADVVDLACDVLKFL